MKKHIQRLAGTLILLLLVSLSAVAQTEDCSNGRDDDGDGLIDCYDSDCSSSPKCKSLGEFDCSDGIDNDGDGYIDYYDSDCANNPDNPNNYIVDDPDCEKKPEGNVFNMEIAWRSADKTSSAMGMPMVADLDGDGIPEVITTNSQNGEIYILDGRDGSTKKKGDIGDNTFAYPAVADVDGDGYGEIFIANQNGVIRAFNHDLSSFWSSTQTSAFTGYGRILNLADFDGDGKVELYQVNEIRNAEDGSVIIPGSHNGAVSYPSGQNNWENELNPVSVAVDILPDSFCPDCKGLELVVGNIIYSVDIASGKLTERLNMNDAGTLPADYRSPGYFPKHAGWANQSYSSTSVVDYNQDGHLDVILSGTTGDENGPTTVFFWDIHNSVVKSFTISRQGNEVPESLRPNFRDLNGGTCDNTNEQCTWRRGAGALNIANIDSDAGLELTFASGSSLYALDENFNLAWANHTDFWESSSGYTGTTVFDFNGDGASEIVYRDEINLHIVDGTTGKPVNGLVGDFCSSQTQGEYPIIADVDGDGETEIIVSCGQSQNNFGTSPATSSTLESGHIKVYKAAGDSYWVPSRSVWNQFSYFNVNINDNLSVPKVQQPHHKPLSLSLNKFLNQSPRISYNGQLVFPAPNLDYAGDTAVTITPPVCPEKDFKVRLVFQNTGDAAVNIAIPVSFYSGDPTISHGNTDPNPYITTREIEIAGGLQVGQIVDTTITVTGVRGEYTLYASLNDIGPFDENGNSISNADFYPLTTLNGPVRECDESPTVVSESVNPYPFDILAKVISDNRNCPGAADNNGEIQVFAADGSVLPSSEYRFSWYNMHTGTTIGDQALVTNLDSGTYVVKVTYDNGAYTCQAKQDTVTVQRIEDWPEDKEVTIEVLQKVSDCKPGTADGKARVLVNGEVPSDADYDIIWVDEQDPDANIIAVGATASGLKQLLYKATVTNKLTGCSESESIDMTLDVPVILKEPTTSAVSNCKQPNGSVNAQLISGPKSSYEYMLIQHSPKQDTTIANNNGSFTNLNVGVYELRAYDPATHCGKYTEGFFVEVKPSKDPELTVEVLQEQTACEAPYNGQLSATIANGKMEDFSFIWYRGYEDPANIVATSATTPDTLSTNITDTYIVIATNTQTTCDAFGEIQLPDNVQPAPTVDYTIISHQTGCTPNGSVQVTASPIGENYVYHLLQGSNTIATNTTGLFTGLEAGPYVAIAENDYTNCTSDPTPVFEIQENIPPLEAVTFNKAPRTNCDPAMPNGALEAVVSNDDISNYHFRWFAGVDTTNAVNPQPDPDASHNLTNIDAGDYVVKVTNKITGCSKLEYTNLTDESVNYQDSITATVLQDQSYCHDDKKSGEVKATLIQSTSGPAPDPANYTFYWYKGRITDLENGTASEISGENSSTLSGQDAGWYTVRAERNDGFGCSTKNAAEVKIEDVREEPVTNINTTPIHQTSCEDNNPNGGLEGNVDGNTENYIFKWFQVIDGVDWNIEDNNPYAVIDGAKVSGISEQGYYILEVEHIVTGCTGRGEPVYIKDNIIKDDEIKLILTPTEAANCKDPDGIAEVTEVRISQDGWNTYETVAVSDYNYQWYEGNDTSTPIPGATTFKLEGVAPGDYTVVATGINTGCSSIYYTTTVESSLQSVLTFDFIVAQEQTDCIDPDGGLRVENVVGGSGDYSYQWYKGGTLDYPINGETEPTIMNIRSDKYTILITDNETGCSAQGTYTLESDLTPVPPATLSSTTHSTTCDFPNGELVAEVDSGVRDTSYPNHQDSDFFYYWFEGENAQYLDPNGDLDDPNNYDVFRNDPPVAGANKSTISNLAPGFYTVIIVDAKDYVASGGTAPFGCQSDARTFEVKAIAKSPEVTFTTESDTMCVGASGSATIKARKRSDDTTPFSGHEIVSVTKYGDDSFTLADLNNSNKNTDGSRKETTFTFTELEDGEYEFRIKDSETTCDTLIRVNIDDQKELPNLLYSDVQVNQHQTTCNPDNGEVAVINPPSSKGQLSDYEFYWYENISTTPGDNPDHTGEVWKERKAGKYYVYARNKTTGCISSYQVVEVKYQVTETVVKKTSVTQNTNCDTTTPNGEITVEAHEEDSNGTVSAPGNGYTFTWYKNDNPYSGTVVNGSSKSTISELEAGTYRVEVKNNDLQCIAKEAIETIKFEPILPVFTAASTTVQHVKTCTDNGSITINEIKENGNIITDFSGYTFEWYQGDLNTQLPETTNTISNLPAETYYVYAINTTTGGCKSADYLQVIVEDKSYNPLIYQTEIIDFITCTGANEGAIEVFTGEMKADIPASSYTFTWYDESGNTISSDIYSTATTSRVSNLTAGKYRVMVRNNDTQCSEEAYYTVGTDVVKPMLSISKKQDQTYCSGNGWAEVTGVIFGGNPENLDDYNFEWYEGSLNSSPMSSGTYGLSADGRSADRLIAGTYLIKAISKSSGGCESFPVSVIIEDKTEELIVMHDGLIDPVIACEPSNKPHGELSVKVRNSSNIMTRWYEGSSINQMADSIPGLGNRLEVKNLIPGFYTVYVEDLVTGCSATRTYEIEGIVAPLTVFLTTTPYSSCISPNGRVAANVSGGSGQPEFYWYAGTDTSAPPIKVSTNTILDNLTSGTYTVVVRDQIEAECEDSKMAVVIEDTRGKDLRITVLQDFPVTNCDETNPNGQLTASINDDISRFNFFWYADRDISKRPVARGITVSKLTPKEYTVVARDKVTGCLSAMFHQRVNAEQDTDVLPAPEVKVLSHVTHCAKPNGRAIAVLDSTLIDPNADYEYIWINEKGQEVFASTRTNIVDRLATGSYQVTARNTATGCYSATAEIQIIKSIYSPEFEVVTTPSTCLESTGTIALEFKEPVQVVDIEWTTPYGYASGFYLINQPPGDYEVRITDANGCTFTKSAKILTNLYVYNGLSPNGDNQNDKFVISCIDQFERNTVRIYNRAGALVYENKQYDNEISYFDGNGNRGLYIGGAELPDGTYFYIIDKHNGEKPVSGYLELLR